MSRFYGPEEADLLLPDLVPIVTRLRDQRAEVAALRTAYGRREAALGAGPAGTPASGGGPESDADPELRRLRLRILGIVDQMQADASWLDARGIVLRDIATGLLDVPAQAGGRPVWLCWQLGEAAFRHWHGTDEGFAGRRPLEELPGRIGSPPGTRIAPGVRRAGLVRQGDRDKAYRPLPEPDRRSAFEAGLAHFAAGEPFEAHEALEPAWMGTADLAERALHQGLIKVAAAYVHAGRGNPAGTRKNLAGARRHLVVAAEAGIGPAWGVDVPALLADIDARLADPARLASAPAPVIRRIPRA